MNTTFKAYDDYRGPEFAADIEAASPEAAAEAYARTVSWEEHATNGNAEEIDVIDPEGRVHRFDVTAIVDIAASVERREDGAAAEGVP